MSRASSDVALAPIPDLAERPLLERARGQQFARANFRRKLSDRVKVPRLPVRKPYPAVTAVAWAERPRRELAVARPARPEVGRVQHQLCDGPGDRSRLVRARLTPAPPRERHMRLERPRIRWKALRRQCVVELADELRELGGHARRARPGDPRAAERADAVEREVERAARPPLPRARRRAAPRRDRRRLRRRTRASGAGSRSRAARPPASAATSSRELRERVARRRVGPDREEDTHASTAVGARRCSATLAAGACIILSPPPMRPASTPFARSVIAPQVRTASAARIKAAPSSRTARPSRRNCRRARRRPSCPSPASCRRTARLRSNGSKPSSTTGCPAPSS